MKKFAKYIPVEGKIMEGDVYTCPHKGKGIDVGFGQPKQVTVLSIYSKSRNLCKDCKKVKLFLCSRDIQVGDNVIIEAHPSFGEKVVTNITERIVTLNDKSKTHDHNLIKVIGEISSEAIWVKEGDEFNDDDFKLFALLSSPEQLVPFIPENKDLGYPTIAKIKCSQCKTFH